MKQGVYGVAVDPPDDIPAATIPRRRSARPLLIALAGLTVFLATVRGAYVRGRDDATHEDMAREQAVTDDYLRLVGHKLQHCRAQVDYLITEMATLLNEKLTRAKAVQR